MSGQNHSITIDVAANISQAVGSIQKIQGELNKLKLSPNLRTSFDTNFKNLYKEIEKYQDIIARGPKTKVDSSALERSGNNILKIYNQIVKEMNSLDGSTLKNAFKDIGVQEVEKLKTEFENLKKTLGEITAKSDFGKNLTSSFEDAKKKLGDLNNEATQLVNKLGKTTFKTFSNNLFSGRFDLAENNLKSIQEQINKLGESVQGKQELVEWVNNLSTAFEQLKNSGDISSFTEKLNELKGTLNSKQADVIQQLINDFSNLKDMAAGTGNELERITKYTIQLTNTQVQFNNEVGQLKSRIQYFFGLANAINLVKRAVRSSFNTVKELDKAMTETAVVTNYTIKDMWKQLPEYTKRANQLGVTTKAAYESATLYYQQGLNTEQAAALSTETLKMARIAGLDAADATDRMTNALRGFNMELNATQAQRVDDVYSQLAAMSASNVDEISTAMTKVASLANNANMKFETTAAFLAQIIETTRESAETAGTALKTVVARFSEVKKLVDTDQLKGQDEEGQVIDVNKVSAALRTAGIDLNKYFLGEVGLDDIFMELSEKWDSLTNIQQRYIATQAAGSRQQSRFIALMQDYSRTQELVGAAYSSTGASQKQFEKTQDSMESKLARLKNAWDEFAMGLANNAVLKGAVDVLTNILQLVNKITNAFGDGVGSIMKWGALIGSLVGVRGIFKNGGFIDKAAGSFLNNTALGNILFKGGILSGNLFGGATAANSTARQAVEEAARQGTRPTVVTTGGLRGLFGNFKQRRAARLEAFNTYSAARGTVLDSDEFYNDLPGLGKLGLKASGSKFLGGISKKLAGTKFASGLGKLLGFGGTAEAATAAAGLAVSLGAVAAAAGAVAIAYKAWYDLSPEGQLKQATKWAETMDKVSENAEKAKNSTKEAYETYKQRNEAVETATTVAGKKKAIQERNEYINSLIQKDKSYAKYLKTSFDSKTGDLVLTIDEADMKQVADDAAKSASNAAAQSSLAQAMMAGKQANVYEAQARRVGANINNQTITRYDEKGIAYTDKMTSAEIAKYSDLALKQSQQKDLMKTYAKNAYARMVDSTDIGAEAADLVSSVMAEAFDEDKYLDQIKQGRRDASEVGNVWWMRGKDYWRKEYLKAYGVEADSSMKAADIASAVGTAKAQVKEQEKTDKISELAKKEGYENIFRALSGEVDIELSTNINQYISGLDESGKKLQEIANILYGGDISKIQEAIMKNAELAKTLQKTNLASIATMGMKKGVKGSTLEKFLGMSADNIAKVLNFSEAAEKSLGEGFTKFLDEIPNYSDKELDSLNTFFGSFNLDNPIQALKKLNSIAADDTNPLLQEMVLRVKEANAATLKNKGYLTQVFMTSEAYEGINESLDKFIEENGKITSENIIELAKSCSDLNTLIEEGQISAQALASVFTTYEQGKIQIEGITTSVLEALSKISSLDYEIEKMYTNISKFDPGKDFGEGIDFVISQLDNLKKYVDNLEFGNEVTQKIYDQIFGKGTFGNLKGTPQQIQEQANKEIERVRQLVENNSYGFMKKAAQEGALGIKFAEEGNTNNFTWDIQGRTTSDLIGNIQNYAKVSEDTARQILAGWLAQSSNTREILNNNDFKAGVNGLAEQYKGQNIITEQEMQAFAAQFGKDISDIQNYADQNGINLPVVVSWQNKDGSTFTEDQLYNKFKEIKEKIEDNKIDAKINIGKDKEGKNYNYIDDPEGMVSHIQNAYKTTKEQAEAIANRYAKENNAIFQKNIEIPEIDQETGEIHYQEIKIKADSIGDLNVKTDQAKQAANYKVIADAIAKAIGSVSVSVDPNVSKDSLATTKGAIEEGLKGVSVSVDVYGNWKGIIGGPSSNDNKTGESNPNDGFGSDVKGGIVSSYASGARHIKPGIALTGEEGPELVWNKEGGYAYLVGKHGPEFANLVPGDQVFPADETKDIIRRGVTPSLAKGGKVVPAYANDGTESNNQQAPGGYPEDPENGKKKKKKDKKTEGAKLDLDKYYNMVEDINELLRLRNLLEKDYEQLLKSEGKTGKEIYDNLSRQLKLLKQRQKIVEDLAQKRKQQILDLLEENKQYANYAWWNDEDQTIEIDWDAIQQIKDKDTASALKEYLSKLEDFQGKYDDMVEQLEEIESNVQEIQKRGKDQYDTLEERVRDALIKQIKDKIDELTEVDRAINETNQKLFNSMQDTLEKQRQSRDNAKTEEDLTDKEKRLAYLRQDSSNANTLEIAKLQEELADARQDYTDNLIDQKISELQKQNEEAQEQRQEQIDLMQRSLDWQEKSGAFWETVYKYISEGTDEMGSLVHGSELETLLKSAEPWDKLSEEQRKTWVNELMGQVAQAIAYLELTRQLEDIGVKKGTKITFTTSGEKLTGALDENGEVELEDSNGKKFKGVQQEDGTVRFTDEDGNLVGYGIVNKEGEVEFKTVGQTLTGTVDKDGNVIVENPDGTTVTYKDVFQDYNGSYRTFESYVSPEKEETETEQSTGEDEGTEYVYHTIQYNDKQHEITRKVKGTSEWHHVKYENHSGNPCTKCGYKKEPSTPPILPIGGNYGGGCFVAGTKIIMSNYIEKNIEDIRVGESVFAYDETLRIFEPKKVIKAYAHYNTPYIMTVILSNNLNIQLTPGHPILTTEGWKSRDIENSLYEHKVVAKLLKVGDEVIGYGKNVFIKEFIINDNINHVNVYNIEIEDLHTFVANKIVVHNSMKSVDDELYGSTKSITKESDWIGNEGLSPNSILNARNTQNFVELDDVLANIYKNGGFSLKNGDNYYDITVNVDQMNSDYDVDRAIERIRTRIMQESAYRNVNTLSRLR